MKKRKINLDIIGFLGSFFFALGCIGVPAILAFLAAIGVGFLINDLILIPLLVVFLGIMIWSLFLSYKIHKNPLPLILSVVCSILIVLGVWISSLIVYLGLAGLLALSIWNIILKKKCESL